MLFIDVRDSSEHAADPSDDARTFANRLESLWKATFSIAAENAKTPHPEYYKSTGDGLMCVWHLPENHDAVPIMEEVLTFAVKLHTSLGARIADASRFVARIGLGLAHGVAAVAKLGDRIDYVGYVPNLASKLQDLARPSGLIVEGKYVRLLGQASARYGLTNQIDLKSSPLAKLHVDDCFATPDVEPTLDWTCLAWPGIAITESAHDEDGPVGLNTKGITVLTHEGLQGKIGTLQVWPRHTPLPQGDRFELIIDDFDALAEMSAQKSVQLVAPEGDLPITDNLCQDLVAFERHHSDFFFAPVRCGLNALAVHPDGAHIAHEAHKKYEAIAGAIRKKRILPRSIGIYDNDGASFPVLLKMVLPDIPSAEIFDLGQDEMQEAVRRLVALANGSQFRLFKEISQLAASLQSGAVLMALGGGAWLGNPFHGEHKKAITIHVPKDDGAYLWVEGAAITSWGARISRTLARFLERSVLSDDHQRRLLNGKPYAASPVRRSAIASAFDRRKTNNGLTAAQRLTLDETAAIFAGPSRLQPNVYHRRRPKAALLWLDAWELFKAKACGQ